MLSNYALQQFKRFLEIISIDIWYVSELEFKDEYYGIESTPTLMGEPYIDEIGIYHEDGIVSYAKQLWNFGFNKLPFNSFFLEYSRLENDLLDELQINERTVTERDEFCIMYQEMISWIKDRGERIKYSAERDLFECDYISYCELFMKITFENNYDQDVKKFCNKLKHLLLTTYNLLNEKTNIPIVKTNLKWEAHEVDLIELITALIENESISVKNGETTWEKVKTQFENIFDLTFKNDPSKLYETNDRKKDHSPFLTSLKASFDKYVKTRDEK